MLPPDALQALRAALGADRVFDDTTSCALYASDETPRSVMPLAVLFPASHDHVAALMRIAYAHRLALTPRGAGSGNVGGALPAPGSLVVSFECMQRVLEFDPANRLIRVEAGIVIDTLNQLALSAGLFYPPDPGSSAYCQLGGNLAMNAAGPHAVKYGTTRDYVLGLRAITGDGRELLTGCRTTKGVTGFDLTRLLIGSEGTLALITEATLKLLPAPEATATLRVCFNHNRAALNAVQRVMSQAVIPSALEFMDRRAIDAIRQMGAADDLPPDTQALLMVEADGAADDLPRQIAALQQSLAGEGLLEIQQGATREAVAQLWRARKSLSHAVKRIAPLKINEDIVVPVSQLADLVDCVDAATLDARIPVVTFGHAGNGNLHVNLMVNPDDDDEMQRAHACLDAIMHKVLALGGTLSGEHGIGTEKRRFLPLEINPATLALMRQIKTQFDPLALLNPGKLFPDS
ncbi:MAG: FAD-linked oxidase C-terminal domain-containing protein [Thiobacillus sp.]